MDEAPNSKSYREGFLEGARYLLRAVGNDMAEEQKRVLEKWVDGPLAAWHDADANAPRPDLPAIDGA